MTAPDPRAIAAGLSDQMRAEGWIEHDGRGCPVPLDSKPMVKFRDGMTISNHLTEAKEWTFTHAKQDLWTWGVRDGPADIIAYRKGPTP